MSGGHEETRIEEPEMVKQVKSLFQVDDKTARKIIDYAVVYSMERMHKWINNYRKNQKNRADDILRLTRQLKKGDKTGRDKRRVINEIEKILLEMCVEQ